MDMESRRGTCASFISLLRGRARGPPDLPSPGPQGTPTPVWQRPLVQRRRSSSRGPCGPLIPPGTPSCPGPSIPAGTWESPSAAAGPWLRVASAPRLADEAFDRTQETSELPVRLQEVVSASGQSPGRRLVGRATDEPKLYQEVDGPVGSVDRHAHRVRQPGDPTRRGGST